ncbi:MAG: hypothetical protein OEO20_01810 [Gemmatimonadota bacterium]|nr:hypothetical protein [Gemmatimonadota bacterium]MDH3366294.1 hypothetical protein [Gemmatimonadota bacterium]MDH3477022.1 hypothetical protein [Gemmatimonadota bacterium]MDH3569126.1 hypothetical protein [Gemmatimonadota bacterium]
MRWLLAGDVSIRWQVMRDLLVTPRAEWEREQASVASNGWGARLLAHQDATGRWTSRLYGQKWVSTTYSMVLLRRLGLPRSDRRAVRPCSLFLEEGLWHDGGINATVTQGRSETCVTGLVLGVLSWFSVDDPRRESLVEYLLREQMDDGGWNCQRDRGAVHSSFHTTINVLEGLREYVNVNGPLAAEVVKAEARAREFLLVHRLYRSHRTNDVVNPAFTRFSFPPRWHHDVLRTLDYFRSSDAPYDERLEDPVGVVLRRRRPDGRWVLQNRHPGKTFFELEQVGKPSRWNTLRALRVLAWWQRVEKTGRLAGTWT